MKKSVASALEQEKTAVEAAAGKALGGEDYFADFDFGSLEVDMKAMLKAGVHFGHQKARKNPKMKEKTT